MEKRAFLAFILMFLLLLIYEMVMRPRPAPVPEGGWVDSTRVVAPPEETVSVPSEGVPAPLRVDGEPEAEEETLVRVETDLVRAIFSNRGPSILSWQLKAFPGRGAEWVELVPDSARGGILLGVWWEDDAAGSERRTYGVDVERLVLDESNPSGEIVFRRTEAGGRTVVERVRLSHASYLMDLEVGVTDPGAERGDELRIGWMTSLPETEPNRKEEERYFASLASVESEVLKKEVKHLKKESPQLRRGNVHWAGVKNKYFATALVPAEGSASAVELGGELEGERLGFAVLMPAREQGGWQVAATVYAGPIDYRILKDLGFGLESVVDFGHKIIRPLSKLVYWMLVTTYTWIPNYGVVIIILSTLTKVLFYPLTQKSMKSMQSMQELQPKMAALKEKYKSDPKRMNQEVMKLYKEHGVNPLGGCLPLLLQSPVFFALYAVLQRTIELRRAPFLLWIDDLSRPDVIVDLPSPLPALSLLPILMGASMFWQQRMSSSGGGDPRQKMMGYMMPIFLTVIFFRMPSGLVLYWLVNTVLSIGQQYLMKRGNLATEGAGA